MSRNLATADSSIPSTISEEIAELTRRLQFATPALIEDCLERMRAGGMELPPGLRRGWLDEYRYALHRVPAYGLVMATKKIKRGEYPDHRGNFVPLPAQLAHLCRIEAESTIEDLTRLKAKANAAKTTADLFAPKDTEEQARQKARIRELHAAFKAHHAAVKAAQKGWSPDAEPIDYESAQYWTLIKNLQDSGPLTAEQQEFRRRIDTEISRAKPPVNSEGKSDD